MVSNICYKSVLNALTRRRSERNEHKRLIEKYERIDALVKSMREQGETTEEQLTEYVSIVFFNIYLTYFVLSLNL